MMPVKRNAGQSWIPSIFNDFFDSNWMARTGTTAPAINVMETEKEYDVEVAAPGMTKEDFDIRIDGDHNLVITMEKRRRTCHRDSDGDKEPEKPQETGGEKEGRYLRREFSYTKFQQTLVLPDDVSRDSITARMSNGVLRIALPKTAPKVKTESTRSIEIE